jgi:hypothetical protein
MASLLVAVVLVAARPLASATDQVRAPDAAVKAAYLFHFGQFVRWPPSALASDAAFTICVLGDDPFGAVLDKTLTNESIGGHPVRPRRLEAAEDAAGCQILFIAGTEARQLPAVLDLLKDRPVLTVSDIADFTLRGGAIGFVTADRRVRFEVNLPAAESAGLVPSSELLRVAMVVRRPNGSR